MTYIHLINKNENVQWQFKHVTNFLLTIYLCKSSHSLLHTEKCVIQREKSPCFKGLRDFEVNKLDIGKDGGNNTITTSILQLYVANWSLNNNFPSLFYISHILSIIESLECENLLIHGTHLGRRADILVAIILLNKEIIKKIEEGIELNDKMIEEAILLFESITKSKKFNKFEFTLIVMSLIAHLIKKGYIQNKTFEKNLREIFIKTINDNKLSNI
uniref:NR LBD domain-containing protein n=1 Tax=Strongyloides papillosus TaxID=174720 RepID=A0A0N5CE89_STREA